MLAPESDNVKRSKRPRASRHWFGAPPSRATTMATLRVVHAEAATPPGGRDPGGLSLTEITQRAGAPADVCTSVSIHNDVRPSFSLKTAVFTVAHFSASFGVIPGAPSKTSAQTIQRARDAHPLDPFQLDVARGGRAGNEGHRAMGHEAAHGIRYVRGDVIGAYDTQVVVGQEGEDASALARPTVQPRRRPRRQRCDRAGAAAPHRWAFKPL
ncbi:hypothetical protein GCM10009575_031040 [Streptomyces rhizosphaericus]|uniref:Uncharacterized protein n=1 Tax=Streptomyces rhizosphaericus TaxID=114699 RepID=A0ABP4A1V9_9ACTN